MRALASGEGSIRQSRVSRYRAGFNQSFDSNRVKGVVIEISLSLYALSVLPC